LPGPMNHGLGEDLRPVTPTNYYGQRGVEATSREALPVLAGKRIIRGKAINFGGLLLIPVWRLGLNRLRNTSSDQGLQLRPELRRQRLYFQRRGQTTHHAEVEYCSLRPWVTAARFVFPRKAGRETRDFRVALLLGPAFGGGPTNLASPQGLL